MSVEMKALVPDSVRIRYRCDLSRPDQARRRWTVGTDQMCPWMPFLSLRPVPQRSASPFIILDRVPPLARGAVNASLPLVPVAKGPLNPSGSLETCGGQHPWREGRQSVPLGTWDRVQPRWRWRTWRKMEEWT